MLPFVENEKKFRLRYKAASNVKGKSLLNKKSLNTNLCMRDSHFATNDELIHLHPSKAYKKALGCIYTGLFIQHLLMSSTKDFKYSPG